MIKGISPYTCSLRPEIKSDQRSDGVVYVQYPRSESESLENDQRNPYTCNPRPEIKSDQRPDGAVYVQYPRSESESLEKLEN